jgi:hypothetical protein
MIKAFVLQEVKNKWEIWDGQFGECVGIAPSYDQAVKMLFIRAGSVSS